MVSYRVSEPSWAREWVPPNKRLKLTGPVFQGIVRLFTSALMVQGRASCARARSLRSLTAIR